MNTAGLSVNRITISGAALEQNYRRISERVDPTVAVLAMVKADAYGHDMVFAAKSFARAGCRYFGVAEIGEGVRLRQAGIGGDIFIMVGFPPEQAQLFFTYNLTPVVFDLAAIAGLADLAEQQGRVLPVQLKVDCGMSRLGISPHQAAEFADYIGRRKGLRLAGVLTHLPASDQAGHPSTTTACELFSAACGQIGDDDNSLLRHIANSGAVLNFPETFGNLVRAGIALYGYAPDGREQHARAAGLIPAMTFATRIAQVKEIAAGTGISYGHTYTTSRPTRLAVLPVGYEDGYSRRLSNRVEVLIGGRRAAIRGRICMNLCMADITDIDGVQAGDEAVLLGSQGDQQIWADEIAGLADSISYEILCMLGNNNIRILEDKLL